MMDALSIDARRFMPRSSAFSLVEELRRAIVRQDLQAADDLYLAESSLIRRLQTIDCSLLTYCAQNGSPAVCKWLLDHQGADVNELDIHGSTALHKACRCGATGIVKVLLKHGADISIAGNHGYNPLMEATVAHRTVVVELLLVHLLSSWGKRNSSGTGGERREEEEEELEEKRARRINTVLNARQHKGQTALAISASSPGMRVEAALLLEAGASPCIPDNDGHLPVDRARLVQQPLFFVDKLGEAMREPQRAWRLAQARVVLDVRQALQGVLGGGEEEEDGMDGGGKDEQETKERGVLEIMKVVPACFGNRLMRRVEEGEKREEEVREESGKEGGKEGRKEGERTLSDYRRLGLFEALPYVEWTPEGHQKNPSSARAAAAGAAGAAGAAAAAAVVKKEEKRVKKERLLATMAFVIEGGLKEELWVELKELMCVRYDGAARAGLGNAGNWW